MAGMRYQPQGLARLNAAHPLARGLAGVWLPGITSRELLTGADSTALATASRVATVQGVGLNVTATGRRYSTSILNGQQTAWLVVAHRSKANANCSPVRKDGTLTPMQEWDGQVRAGAFNPSGGGFLAATNYGPVSNFAGRISTFCGIQSNDDRVIFSNGGPSIAFDRAYAFAGNGTNPFCIGAAEFGGEIASNWTILAVFLWQGQLVPSVAQLRQIEANPWQLFADPYEDDEIVAATSGGTVDPPDPTDTAVIPAAGALTLTGYAPSVVRGVTTSTAPDAAALAITGYAPSVTQGMTTTVAPAPASLSVTGFAPTVSQTAARGTNPAPAGLTLTGYAPTVTRGASLVVAAGAPTALTVTGYAPSITQANNVTPHYADATIMRLSVVRAVVDLGPDHLYQTAGLP